MLDKKGKEILFQTYWNKGWRESEERYTSPSDFEYAKKVGLMFDPITITHDECISKIISLRDSITKDKVVEAFLSSLSTRRLDWRSGIASWHISQQLQWHTYQPVISGTGYDYDTKRVLGHNYTCSTCKNTMYGVIGDEIYSNMDLNVLNFERIKWGGVRHGDIIYILFDLMQFYKEEIDMPRPKDIEIFKEILYIIKNSNPDDTPSILRKKILKVL